MESSENNPQLELLAKIHNQLTDIKSILVEVELAKSGTSHELQSRLRELLGDTEHVDGGHTGPVVGEHQRVIAPENTDIQAGEARDTKGGK